MRGRLVSPAFDAFLAGDVVLPGAFLELVFVFFLDVMTSILRCTVVAL
jgi:hypothetical protein